MTQDEIIRIAREVFVDIDIEGLTQPQALERFAALVAAHEREACAKVCEEVSIDNYGHCDGTIPSACAEYIRARSEK